MTSRKSRPADSLDFAALYATLALALCPDEVRWAMIAVLDETIPPGAEERLCRLLDELDDLNDLEPGAIAKAIGYREPGPRSPEDP